MQFRKDCVMKDCKVMGIFVPKCSETHRKGQKIHVSSDREEGKSPRTLG